MWSPALAEVLSGVQNEALASLAGAACSRERFLQLVRDQVRGFNL